MCVNYITNQGVKYMKTIGSLLILLLTITGLSAEIFVLNTISQTISKIDLSTGTVNNAFAVTGLFPNKMVTTNTHIYVTNSGDNNVQKIDMATGMTTALIPLENNSNPYDIIIYHGYAYVTGMLTNKVYQIDLSTDSVVSETSVGVAPLGLAAYRTVLVVANSGYQYPSYLPGEISTFALNDMIPLSPLEVPLSPYRMLIDDNDLIHLVCSGNYNDQLGSVNIIDLISGEIVRAIPLPFFATNIVYNPLNNRIYVADAFGTGLFAYDLPDYEVVYDGDNLFSSGGSAVTYYDGKLYIADAGDFSSNSLVRVYDTDDNLLETYQTGIGAVDITYPGSGTGLENNSSITYDIKIYPNPFSQRVLIFVVPDTIIPNNINTYNIYNIKGEKVYSFQSGSAPVLWLGDDDKRNKLPSGVYLLEIRNKYRVIYRGKLTYIK